MDNISFWMDFIANALGLFFYFILFSWVSINVSLAWYISYIKNKSRKANDKIQKLKIDLNMYESLVHTYTDLSEFDKNGRDIEDDVNSKLEEWFIKISSSQKEVLDLEERILKKTKNFEKKNILTLIFIIRRINEVHKLSKSIDEVQSSKEIKRIIKKMKFYQSNFISIHNQTFLSINLLFFLSFSKNNFNDELNNLSENKKYYTMNYVSDLNINKNNIELFKMEIKDNKNDDDKNINSISFYFNYEKRWELINNSQIKIDSEIENVFNELIEKSNYLAKYDNDYVLIPLNLKNNEEEKIKDLGEEFNFMNYKFRIISQKDIENIDYLNYGKAIQASYSNAIKYEDELKNNEEDKKYINNLKKTIENIKIKNKKK